MQKINDLGYRVPFLMRRLVITYVLILTGVIFSIGQNQKDENQKSPNIIVVLVDDLGYADVGFNGCEDIPTPNIDKIAAEGVKFTNAYVSYAVCGPSRAGLITGRYQDRFGFGRNPLFAPNDPNMGLPLTEETLAEALKKGNYKSVALGKWHLGAHKTQRPLERGFDDFFGFLSGGHNYFPEMWSLENEYEVKKQFDAYKTKLLKNNTRVEESEYLTDALTREAVNYIEKYKAQPFFMYLAYNAPHSPLQATEKYLQRFESIRDDKRKTYAAMVSAVDDGVGSILNKLDELNLTGNTIVWFLSDNGGPEKRNASNNGILRGGKSDLFEGGIRVPFAMKWPKKFPTGKVYDNAVISLDIFATVIAQTKTQINPKNKLDGVNLIPYLTGEKSGSPHDFLFWRKFDKSNYAVRNASGDKIIGLKDKLKMYNLDSNISEDPRVMLNDKSLEESLNIQYETWNTQMIDPVFLGLLSDGEYNELHPNRFKRKKQN
jgi:arylsulfatase A-like enzyme